MTRCHDVRLQGFSALASAEQAMAWGDAHGERLPAETVATGGSLGRVRHAAIQATADLPEVDRATEDGYAVRSRETIGAAAYNPLFFALQEPGTPLGPAGAALATAGAPLPGGADAVLPFSAANREAAGLEILAAVAEGTGVERRAHELRAGASLVDEGRALRPQDLARLC
jgi:molybdopterin biosynthesis enzyme